MTCRWWARSRYPDPPRFCCGNRAARCAVSLRNGIGRAAPRGQHLTGFSAAQRVHTGDTARAQIVHRLRTLPGCSRGLSTFLAVAGSLWCSAHCGGSWAESFVRRRRSLARQAASGRFEAHCGHWMAAGKGYQALRISLSGSGCSRSVWDIHEPPSLQNPVKFDTSVRL